MKPGGVRIELKESGGVRKELKEPVGVRRSLEPVGVRVELKEPVGVRVGERSMDERGVLALFSLARSSKFSIIR